MYHNIYNFKINFMLVSKDDRSRKISYNEVRYKKRKNHIYYNHIIYFEN